MKTTYRQRAVRPAWQRAFLQWFMQHRQRFLTRLSIVRRSDNAFHLIFTGLSSGARQMLDVEVRKNGLSVFVQDQNRFHDLLWDDDVVVKRKARKCYFDPWVLPEYQRDYESLSELRIHLLYEPFLKWVNDELSCARWLGVYRESEAEASSSYARLLHHPQQLDMRLHPEAGLFKGLVRLDGQPAIFSKPEQWVQQVLPLHGPFTQNGPYTKLLGHLAKRFSVMGVQQVRVSWIQRTMMVGYNQACALHQQLCADKLMVQEGG